LAPPVSAQTVGTRESGRDAVRACSTPAFGPVQEMSIGERIRDHIARGGLKNLDLFGKHVWVYFHVIHDGEQGLLPEEDVEQQIKALNEQFGDHPPLSPPYSYD